MIKKIVASLALGLFIISCKKSDSIATNDLQNNKNIITSNPPQPLPVSSQQVFFYSGDTLFAISKINSVNPVITTIGRMINAQMFSELGVPNANAFNRYGQAITYPIYNPFTDEILTSTSNGSSNMFKCFTVDKTVNQSIFADHMWNFFHNQLIRIHPRSGELYYTSVLNTEQAALFKVNLNKTSEFNLLHTFLTSEQQPPAFAGSDMDFGNEIYYHYSNVNNNIYKLDLKTGTQKMFLSGLAIPNETTKNMQLLFDDVHNRIFFSTNNKINKTKSIWRVDASGNNLKEIRKVPYTNASNDLNFSLSPDVNVVFVCNRNYNISLQKNSSTLTRIFTDGSQPKLLKTAEFMNTVVAAEPVK